MTNLNDIYQIDLTVMYFSERYHPTAVPRNGLQVPQPRRHRIHQRGRHEVPQDRRPLRSVRRPHDAARVPRVHARVAGRVPAARGVRRQGAARLGMF